jgi:tetratricopeptide (TPR) repeat protein
MRSNRLYETGSFFLSIPGSKLPGYYRSVPPGQEIVQVDARSSSGPISRLCVASSVRSLTPPGQNCTLMRDFPMEEIPESVAELFDDANGDLAVGDLPAAVEKYRKCTEIEPTFFDGWHALGMALMKNGQYPEAIEAGNKAVELRPNDQLAWSSLSLFYVRNHQIKEAEAASGKARILSWGGKIVRDTKE